VVGDGRFLDDGQVALLLGEHPTEDGPSSRRLGPGAYVAGVDVAGEDDEGPSGEAVRVNPRRDSTILTIAYAAQTWVEERVFEPTFEVARQYAWRGDRHRELYPRILELVGKHWGCRSVVVDATGVGGGPRRIRRGRETLTPRLVLATVWRTSYPQQGGSADQAVTRPVTRRARPGAGSPGATSPGGSR
jgi:hypothetical protein